MRIAIMQPYIFPYIGYFQLMHAADKFIFLDDVAYINKGWINRNRILVGGKEHLFSIPLIGASQNRLINSIELMQDGKWQAKFLRTIEMAYRKAPCYSTVYPMIENIVKYEEPLLSLYVENSFRVINAYLGIETELLSSSVLPVSTALKGQERILALCRNAGTDAYLNPIGGTELYSKENFSAAGLDLFFVKSNPVTYKQWDDTFVPWLSIIDLLMFTPAEEARRLLDEYELV